ncbi:MAG: MBL fold metallo-hydrolase [Chloroflexota bacterium]|nr:MBL fold metallo-hydrolase [Chloroflexota bacterium]
MARVVVLGSAAAVPDEAHANTYLAVEGEHGFFLIDCGDSPLVRIQRAGLAPERLRGLIITHFHPDHVFGLPILLMNTWLLGRTDPLPVYGLQDALERFEVLMGLFRWQEWPGLFPVSPKAVTEEVGALLLEDTDFRITGAPVKHLVPTLGLRIENKRSGRVVAYSSDTSPCDAVVTLARGADVLIHEAAKNTLGHSSAAQAGEVARRAGAGRLVLIHYRPAPWRYDHWLEEATTAFGGPVELAQDFGEYVF